jgi:hypothetical protein
MNKQKEEEKKKQCTVDLMRSIETKKEKEKKEHFNDHEIHWHKVMSIVMYP